VVVIIFGGIVLKKLTTCKSCGKEVARSAKSCPHCGQKLKMSFFLRFFILFCVVGVIAVIVQPSKEEQTRQREQTLAQISKAKVDDISAIDMGNLFNMMSKNTDIQREKKEKETIGKIIQWSLPVYEVKQYGDYYKIQTSGKYNGVVGTFITIYPRNEQEKAYIEALKTDDILTVKGRITGTFMRNINIEDALLIK
jgi:hypothetical protein